MERHKDWPPLTDEDKRKICKECGAFCCNYFFVGLGEGDAPKEFHKFRGRKITRYGKVESIIMPDPCPHCKDNADDGGWCRVYEDRPEVCHLFPETYAPFWAKKCKLMRELYKRKQIRKAEKKFNQILRASGVPPKSPFKHFK